MPGNTNDVPALVMATDLEGVRLGVQMLERGTAWGLIYVEDRSDGNLDVRYVLGRDHAHRVDEIRQLIARGAARTGGVLAHPLLIATRGAA